MFHNILTVPYAMFLQVLNGEPIDPVTMFEVTHEFKKCKDTTKCDEIKVYVYVFFLKSNK